MLLKNIDPFIRFADTVDYSITRDFTRTYDCRMLYILSGSGTVDIHGNLYALQEDIIINFQPGTPYKIVPSPGFRAVAVDYDFTQEHREEISVFPPVSRDDFDEDKAHGTVQLEDAAFLNEALYIENAYYARRYITELIEEFNSGKMYFREKSGLIFKNMMFEIARNYQSSDKVHQICEQVAYYIASNYRGKVTNKDIAAMFSIDPDYLNKLFKASTGKTIHQALIDQRISAASKLLLTTNTPLEKIAYETGFYGLAHFSALFKRSTGHPPSYYRKGK